MEPSDVYLYILMRTDLASMNSGKACAQATHAANQCVYDGRKANKPELTALIDEWEAETGHGFGTCIVLGVTERSMRQAVELASRLGLHTGICHDPSYPLMDGKTLHLIPLDTCAFVFGRKSDVFFVTENFDLLP